MEQLVVKHKVLYRKNKIVLPPKLLANYLEVDSKDLNKAINDILYDCNEGEHYFTMSSKAAKEFIDIFELKEYRLGVKFRLWTATGFLKIAAQLLNNHFDIEMFDNIDNIYNMSDYYCIPDEEVEKALCVRGKTGYFEYKPEVEQKVDEFDDIDINELLDEINEVEVSNMEITNEDWEEVTTMQPTNNQDTTKIILKTIEDLYVSLQALDKEAAKELLLNMMKKAL